MIYRKLQILSTLLIVVALAVAMLLAPSAALSQPSQAEDEATLSEKKHSDFQRVAVHHLWMNREPASKGIGADYDFGIDHMECAALGGEQVCVVIVSGGAEPYYYDWSYPCNDFDGESYTKCEFSCFYDPVSRVSVTVTDANNEQDSGAVPTTCP